MLKCWREPLQSIWSGKKVHEVRVNDRYYQAGDQLLLREYDPRDSSYTGREVVTDVTYVTPGGSHGLPEDVVVMSIRVVSRTEPPSPEHRNINELLVIVGRQPSSVTHGPDGTTTVRFRVGGRDRYVEVSDSVESNDFLVTRRDCGEVTSVVLSKLMSVREISYRVREWLDSLSTSQVTGSSGNSSVSISAQQQGVSRPDRMVVPSTLAADVGEDDGE